MNLLDTNATIGCDTEVCEDLAVIAGVRVERIVSRGQKSSEGFWYDQDHDEWVAVLQGEGVVGFDDGSEVRLGAGDTLLLPAHTKHRVVATSVQPPCIWIGVHGPARAH